MTHLPRGVEWLLRLGLPADQREPIAGDLEEEYAARVRRGEVLRAWLAMWWQAARLALTFRWERTAHGRPLPPIADEAPRRFTLLESMTQDALFALRLLRRQPGFTLVVVLMLALGIGANTAIFGVVDTVLWRPLPYPASDRIVSIAEQRPREERLHGVVAPDDFYDWRRDAQSFVAMAASEPAALNVSGTGDPERLRALLVTPGFLDVLGIAPAIGRDFRAEEETPGKHRVVLITDGLWRRRFGAEPSIVGQSITLNGAPWVVIGVLPAAFWWPAHPDLIVPYPSVEGGDSMRALHSMNVVARLKPGIPFEQGRAEMDAVGKRLSETYPQTNAAHFPHVIPLQEAMVGHVRPAMLVLLGAVALVLLIACANVATLLLARATGRHREIGVRIALGAGRGRLVRQMLTESVLLAIVGGTAGLLVAAWSIAAFRAILPAEFTGLPGIERIGVDARVLTVALVVSVVTGLVFGVLPAITASDQYTAATLHEQGRGGGAGARSGRMRAGLVIAEVALSLMLLVGAGLLIVSFKQLLDVSPGFEPRNLVTAPLALPGNRYDSHSRLLGFYQPLMERVRAMPGVESVGVVTALPFSGSDSRSGFQIEGRTGQSPVPVRANWRLVSPGYLSTLGVPLVRGRLFTDYDADGSPDVVIINAAAARRFWPGEDPIGRRITFVFGAAPRWIEIVGVVGDIKHTGLDVDSNPEAYLPLLQTNLWGQARNTSLVVRTSADAAAMAPMIRAAVQEIDRSQPVGVVSRMDALIERSFAARRLNLWLVSGFAIVAVVLTGAGLYGVMAYLVAQRTHEIGVRMALGAPASRVLALVLRQAGVMTVAGIVIGLAGAFAMSRFVAGLLFGVRATEPSVYAAVSIVLAMVALIAVAIPSSRATRVDPITALRES
jgi:putative ABC transport system permease protein